MGDRGGVRLKIVHLFNPDIDSRSLLQVAQGLLKQPDVEVSFSHNVPSLGEYLAHKSPFLEQDIRQADYIFRPNDSHFNLPEIDRMIPDWSRVIIYDIHDDAQFDYREGCAKYLKRNPDGDKFDTFPYAVLDEYCIMPEVNRDIDLVFLFNEPSDTHNEHNRYLVYQELLKMNLPDNCIIGTTTYPDAPRTNGRRLIFEPKGGNRFVQYLGILKRAKIVATCSPDHNGGDSRLWEAFASGALVVTDRQRNLDIHPGNEHCILFNPPNLSSINDAIKMALNMPDGLKLEWGARGKAFALQYHSAEARIKKVLDDL